MPFILPLTDPPRCQFLCTLLQPPLFWFKQNKNLKLLLEATLLVYVVSYVWNPSLAKSK
jgi:hypothetical protein